MNNNAPAAIQLSLACRVRGWGALGTSDIRNKVSALKESGVDVINFADGELSFDASEAMKTGAVDAIRRAHNRYTSPIGMPAVREALAKDVSQRCGVSFVASEVAVTAGARQALFNAAMVLLNPGDEVVVPAPYGETFPAQILLAGAVPVYVDTRADDYRLTCKAVEQAISPRTRMIVINTPNNPTGTVYQREQLLLIARLAYDHKLWVVFDESYRKLIRQPHEHHNIVSLFPALKEQTLLVDSFSKSHSVAGWRVGYVCAPANVVAAMHNLQGHTTSNPSTLSQYAVLNTLNSDSTNFTREVNTFLDQQLQAAFICLSYVNGITCAPAEGAFYLFINVERQLGGRYLGVVIRDVDHLTELLLTEAHIAVVSGSGCGAPGCIRICYAVGREALIQGLTRLGQFMSEVMQDK
ncbi:aminotransferase class I/II-fold pyridoxal phosphate-dependent enzyme [Pseudomonas viridiflava]|uniref:Aminotransferase n=1 Tax=Pseudomonas viridiflava TaxID=33069 RepID=A0A3M5PG16_PSEVI|nr:aminotransferase class I/II-fold pyridoxal phosphate-dependent enzyme [Pseudomonas viridiflava]RMT82956.1 Aminotransferase [Pseudomonas viridiflava]